MIKLENYIIEVNLNFKKIEIYGFKSFADKIDIEFNGGVNCIVGPNGCGKSNVADAIRWVLGEQSARVLRAEKSMSEIIFDGTKNRRSLSYCEVSIHFDNTERNYLIDYDELAICRKLFRNGDSEYYINNERVRLRDIVDLFRDTGIGREGYSIIGQGKISDILSAKPDERRQIFEEAAGISKFKAKRKIAERELGKTRDNMVRINDRIISLETDLGPLEKESEDALKAREFKEELKILEVNTFLYQTENNAERKKEITTQTDMLNVKIKESESKLGNINANYEKVVGDINNTDEKYKYLYDKRLELSLKHQQVMGQQSASIEKLEDLKKRDIELNLEIGQKERALDESRYTLEKKKANKEEKLKELLSLKQDDGSLIEKQEDAERAFKQKAQELEDTNKYILSSSDEKGEIKAELASLNAQIDGLVENIKQDKETFSVAKLGLNDVRKNKKFYDEEKAKLDIEIEKRAEQKREIDNQYEYMLEQMDQAQTQQMDIKQNVSRLNAKTEMLEEYKKNYGGFGEAIKRLMKSEDENVSSRIQGVVGKEITVSPNLQVAIEISLGRSIQNIITNDEQDTAYLVNYLKRNDYGRATFLALSRMMPRPLREQYRSVLEEEGCIGLACDLIKYDRKYRNIFGYLLGSVVIVEDIETANRLSKIYRSGFRIVTLDGEDFSIGGATTGGSKPKPDTSILSRDAVLKEAYKQIAILTSKHKIITSEIEDYKRELKQLEDTSNLSQNQLSKLEKDLSTSTERCHNLETEEKRLAGAVEKLDADIKSKQESLTEKQKLFKAENNRIDEAESKKISADELLGRLRAEYTSKEGELSQFNKRITEAKLGLNTVEHAISSIEAEINNLENDIKHLSSSILDLKARKCTNDSLIESLNKQLKVLELPKEEQEELNHIEYKISEIDDYKIDLRQRQETLRLEESNCKKVLFDLTMKKSNIENLLLNIDSDTQQLANKITEDYELDYETAQTLKREDFDEEKSISQIRTLKRNITRLGDINEKAVEQFAEKSQEYNELSTHYKDITEAEESLVKTIKDLIQKMESIFSENFEKIQENFKNIFKEIFDGGKGMLELNMENCNSVLDAGIEIYAEPPGKQLKNISLLSGGERALTAIAILFAIIRLKPMPFCVLDEIEAALDDANAYLFAQFLRQFATETQFIVITHRKPTMELADCLYGVTMQEKGVSKVVRVKLSTALRTVEGGA